MNQREIKFRQAVLLKGKFIRWHYWGFIKKGIFVSPITGNENGGNSYQYTGLKNRNKIEIYEGDIIATRDILWVVEPILSLEQDELYYGLCVSPNGNGKNYFVDESILDGKLIGNIYENPDLLNATTR